MDSKPDRTACEAALRALNDRLAVEPDALDARLARARLSTALGRFDAARADYLAALAREPTHLDALNDLGTLLHSTQFLTAARTCYAEAIKHHPAAALPRVNLANMLLDAGEIGAAREHYEAALAIDPQLPEAHQGMARIFAELGEDQAAAEHRRLGFADRYLVEQPYFGGGDGIPLLILVASIGGNIATRFLIDERVFRCRTLVADFCNPAMPLPPHAAIFNAIGDADLARPALDAARALAARSAAPVINAPVAVLATGRVETARRLAAIPGVVAPRTLAIPRDELVARGAAALRARGFEFPLLLRRPGFHTGRHFLRLDQADQIDGALAALPGAELIAIEFLDARSTDGLVRKYRAMIVDGRLYPLHLAISAEWKVHYFTADMAERPDHRAEEARYLCDMTAAIGPSAVAALARIGEVLALDYGGIDFGLDQKGRVLLFEANAGMVVNPPDPDPRWDYRRDAIARVLDAVRNMLAARTRVRRDQTAGTAH
jgi:tetratricopeptide (TPR) repeat protein